MPVDLRIPITYTRRPGPDAGLMVERSPTIEIVIGYAPNAQSNFVKAADARFCKVRALIDTGADEIHVDRQLLLQCGCPVVGTSNVTTPDVSQANKRYRAQLVHPELGLEGEVEVISHDWGDLPRVYKAILGTRFLELGRLVIEPHGESYFKFHAHSTTVPDQSAE
jgi:predicted aspartyl protease